MTPDRGLQRAAVPAALGLAALSLILAYAGRPYAQGLSNLVPNAGQQATSALTGSQQSLANKLLCKALSSQVSNPASASPSMLSSAGVMGPAASMFAGSTKLPLPSATSMLQSYVAKNGTSIIASCAVSNATSGLGGSLPGSNLIPSMPK